MAESAKNKTNNSACAGVHGGNISKPNHYIGVMTTMRLMRALSLLLLCLAASTAEAATYSVPSDRDLIHRAAAIVEGEITSFKFSESGPLETRFTLRLAAVHKGAFDGSELSFVMPGGQRGKRWGMIAGAPQFRTGDRVLLFLQRKSDGNWTSYALGLGAFFATGTGSRELFTRETRGAEILGWDDSGKVHVERDRNAAGFRSYITDVVRGADSAPSYFVDAESRIGTHDITAQSHVGSYLLQFCGATCKPARWPNANYSMKSIRTQNGASGHAQISSGMSAWNNDSNSDVAMSFDGDDTNQTPSFPYNDDGRNSVVFDTTSTELSEVGNAAESIGYTAIYGDGSEHTWAGESMYGITESDVFIHESVTNSGSLFQEVLTHEIGHSLGFKHGPGGNIMSASVNGSYGTSLQQWDRDAVQTVYGPGPACTAPSITTQPKSVTVDEGFGAKLSVTASGSTPLAYQWYSGQPGSGSAIANATSNSYTTTVAGDYYVRVSNSCGAIDSNVATVTVNPCTAPAITGQPQSQTILSGQSATLSVNATGSNLQYQWYIKGSNGYTAISGANLASYSTGVLTTTAVYRVRVSNTCGAVESSDATVTVESTCQPPAITSHTVNATVETNKPVTLTVTATGTSLMYQWYAGAAGDTSQPIANATGPTFTSAPLATSTSFWVRVKNSCGEVDSATIPVTVGAACTIPTITAQPAGTTINIGGTATLSVDASGTTPLSYQWYIGASGNTSTPVAGATAASYTTPALGASTSYWVRVTNSCGHADSATATITTACTALVARGPGEIASGQTFRIVWNTIPGISTYEIQEATSADFVGATTRTESGNAAEFRKTVTAPTRFFYRVRALGACGGSPTPFSKSVDVTVVGVPSANDLDPNATAPEGSTTPIVFTYKLMPPSANGEVSSFETTSFTATTGTTSWMTVTPSSGTVPATGTTLTVTTQPSTLPTGTNTGTLTVTTTTGSTNTTTNVPISVSIVTPVTPEAKSTPPPAALLIPVVGHASGANGSKFLSDIRITNTASQKMTYDMTFTPTGQNGTVAGKKTRIEIAANDTKAFNDVVKNWFGLGSTGESAVGVLEIRPVGSGATVAEKVTVASSRTYNLTDTGTFGQYIPAIPASDFVAKSADATPKRISLQQVAESATYRTNFGIVEGSGQPVSVIISVFDAAGTKVRDIPLDLGPFEHRQFRLLQQQGITLNDGRIEVQVTSATGNVTAYASVVDNRTNDPLLVLPVVVGEVMTNRYVLPGIADITNATNSWRSDVRLYNSSDASVNATMTYYPQNSSGAPVTRNVAVGARSVVALDNILQSRFGLSNTGGSLLITTPIDTPLVVTARTYDDQREKGTYGQFIPAVTSADAVGVGDARPLQVLQLEESDRFRTNLGLAEVTGNDVVVELVGYTPDSKVAVIKQIGVPANGLLQIGRALDTFMGLKPAYNARVSVRVIGGQGRIAAYASVIDNKTQDPTYVPAQ